MPPNELAFGVFLESSSYFLVIMPPMLLLYQLIGHSGFESTDIHMDILAVIWVISFDVILALLKGYIKHLILNLREICQQNITISIRISESIRANLVESFRLSFIADCLSII